MIANEHKAFKIHHFITCAFRTSWLDATARSGFLFACAGSIGLVSGRGELVAALPLRTTASATNADLSSRSNDRWGGASGGGFYRGVVGMSLDILLARGVIDRRALNILLSSRDGQARLQSWVERAAQDEADSEELPISIPRDTESSAPGHETHASEAGFSRFAVIKWLLILIVAVVIFKSF